MRNLCKHPPAPVQPPKERTHLRGRWHTRGSQEPYFPMRNLCMCWHCSAQDPLSCCDCNCKTNCGVHCMSRGRLEYQLQTRNLCTFRRGQVPATFRPIFFECIKSSLCVIWNFFFKRETFCFNEIFLYIYILCCASVLSMTSVHSLFP